jgi:hypothetical protein
MSSSDPFLLEPVGRTRVPILLFELPILRVLPVQSVSLFPHGLDEPPLKTFRIIFSRCRYHVETSASIYDNFSRPFEIRPTLWIFDVLDERYQNRNP